MRRFVGRQLIISDLQFKSLFFHTTDARGHHNKLCIYQRHPVRVQISNFQGRHKLRQGNHQEVEVEEELELVVKNLRKRRGDKTDDFSNGLEGSGVGSQLFYSFKVKF